MRLRFALLAAILLAAGAPPARADEGIVVTGSPLPMQRTFPTPTPIPRAAHHRARPKPKPKPGAKPSPKAIR